MHLDPVVEVEDGVVSYAGRLVLRRVRLRVEPGEAVALLGANGSGKSTLVRALLGLVPLAAGSIRLFGQPLAGFRDWARIGYVPQRTTATSGVPASVREVVASGRLAGTPVWRALGSRDWAVVDTSLGTVGLADRAADPVAALSGGQQQRVLIARALASEPDLLVMDEPMAGVDLDNQESLAATLDALLGTGTTLLLVAHELGPMERQVRRAVVLRDGHVVHDGAPPPAIGHHADPAHDHVHPHDPVESGSAHPWQIGLRTGRSR